MTDKRVVRFDKRVVWTALWGASRALGSFSALACLVACASPEIVESPGLAVTPEIAAGQVRSSDGYRLPLRAWSRSQDGLTAAREQTLIAEQGPAVVVLALHGFNDYGQAFAPLARSLSAAGVRTYAVDQRGFGATVHRGRWHGSQRLVEDLRVLIDLLRKRDPEARLVLLGESMGAAVALAAMAGGSLPVDGVILLAPAVWSRELMPWYQRLALDAMTRVAPAMRLTGEGIDIRPSDNLPALRAMSADPLVVKVTRVDALWGVTNLMDLAVAGIDSLRRAAFPVLLLYGERDEIIPPRAFCAILKRLPAEEDRPRLILYRQGWHMLARDLQAERVHRDIAVWLRDADAPFPSGEEVRPGAARLRAFCGRPSSGASKGIIQVGRRGSGATTTVPAAGWLAGKDEGD